MLDHWAAWLAPRRENEKKQKSLQELMSTINNDPFFTTSALNVLRERFWFVVILERLSESYDAFCRLGRFPRCGTFPPQSEGMKHRSGRLQSTFQPTYELRKTVRRRNNLDYKIYDSALIALDEMSRK